MVRLVFRPYTQVSRTICTSVSLRASIRVAPDFTLLMHSSPSFGSKQLSSCSYASQKFSDGRCCQLTPWHPINTFITLMSFSLANSLNCLTPWSVFQDGSIEAISTGSHKPLGPQDAASNSPKEISFWRPRTPSCLQRVEDLPPLHHPGLWRTTQVSVSSVITRNSQPP